MTDTEVKTETNGQSATVTKSGDENPAKQNLSAEELEPKIVRQIEHYFGDYNLPRDKFLKETIKADDGWVPMETMLNFQRLAALSTDAKIIMAALKKGGSGLMEVDEDNQKIRRCPTVPLPEWNDARREELMNSTVYVKGFDKDATFEDLLTFFMRFPGVLNVVYRKYKDLLDPECKEGFKGSVFVVFKDKESAQKFMSLEPLKSIDGNVELERKWKKEYDEEKNREYFEKKRKQIEAKDSRKKAAKFCHDGKADETTSSGKVGHKRKSGVKHERGAKRRKNMDTAGSEISCYNCGEKGHFKRECPQESKNQGKSKSCYNCGECGHIKRDCKAIRQDSKEPRVSNECKNNENSGSVANHSLKQEVASENNDLSTIKEESILDSAKAMLEAAKSDIETAKIKIEESKSKD